MRRGDFVYSGREGVPTIKAVRKQIRKLLKKLKLEKVFLATDASEDGMRIFQFVYFHILKHFYILVLCFLHFQLPIYRVTKSQVLLFEKSSKFDYEIDLRFYTHAILQCCTKTYRS